jgi:hypothetical protein
MTNPLPLPFLLLLQVIIQDIEVRACAALYLMLPRPAWTQKGWCPGSSWIWTAMIYLFSIDSQRRIAVGGPALLACRSETALGCTMREAGWESFACFTCFACCLFQYR